MITPLNDRVIVKRNEEVEGEELMESGLYKPDNAKEKPYTGLVIAVGSGKVINNQFVKLDVVVGDTVTFSKYSGMEVERDGLTLLVLREEDILFKG